MGPLMRGQIEAVGGVLLLDAPRSCCCAAAAWAGSRALDAARGCTSAGGKRRLLVVGEGGALGNADGGLSAHLLCKHSHIEPCAYIGFVSSGRTEAAQCAAQGMCRSCCVICSDAAVRLDIL